MTLNLYNIENCCRQWLRLRLWAVAAADNKHLHNCFCARLFYSIFIVVKRIAAANCWTTAGMGSNWIDGSHSPHWATSMTYSLLFDGSCTLVVALPLVHSVRWERQTAYSLTCYAVQTISCGAQFWFTNVCSIYVTLPTIFDQNLNNIAECFLSYELWRETHAHQNILGHVVIDIGVFVGIKLYRLLYR